jgi:hypothetical protein
MKVINTDIVLTSLSSVGRNATAKATLRKEGHPIAHYTKFKFEKKNNIITARFLSGGITKEAFLKEIDSYQYYLEKTLNTTIEREKYEGAETLKVKRKPGSGFILVNFVHIITRIPGKEDNKGIQYELDIIKKLKDAGYTQQTKAEENEEKVDVKITVNNISAAIELKQDIKAAFGSGTLEFENNSWRISPKSSPAIKDLFNKELVDWVNEVWYDQTNGYIPNKRATQKDQQVLDRGETHFKDITTNAIIEYYEKADYIQIKGKGFYNINDKNPLNIPSTKVSKFKPILATARIRVKSGGEDRKSGGGDRYAYKVELYVGNIEKSDNSKGLDGDLSFLDNQ